MAGWFNIDYLRDPSFVRGASGGSAYTAMGSVLDKFGNIINAERDRKYNQEQDKLKNERESAKNAADIGAISALEALRKAQEQKAVSDMEQSILNGANLRGYRNGQLGLTAQRNAEIARNNAFNNGIARERLDYEQDGGMVAIDPEDFEALRDSGVLNKTNSMLVGNVGYVNKKGGNITLKQRNAGTQLQNAMTRTAPRADKITQQ